MSSLAGIAVDQQGHELVFVLMADDIEKPKEAAAEQALDNAAAALAAASAAGRSP